MQELGKHILLARVSTHTKCEVSVVENLSIEEASFQDADKVSEVLVFSRLHGTEPRPHRYGGFRFAEISVTDQQPEPPR